MCYDLNEYDPFEPLMLLRYDGELEPYDEPMQPWDWDEFLEFNDLSVDSLK